jgi:hypothetical protein
LINTIISLFNCLRIFIWRGKKRAVSFEAIDECDDMVDPDGIYRSNSSEQIQEIRKKRDSKGNYIYFDKFGRKISHQKGMS